MSQKSWTVHVSVYMYLASLISFNPGGAEGRSDLFLQLPVQYSNCDTETEVNVKANCVFRCLAKEMCHGFVYNSSKSVCNLCVGEHLTELSFQSSPSTYFRHHACWDPLQHPNYKKNKLLPLPTALVPGMMIRMSFTPLANWCVIDFNDQNLREVFHINVRLLGATLILNSRLVKWGREVLIRKPFPFALGKASDVDILMTTDRFKIYLDQVYGGEFVYRAPLENIHHISFISEVVIHNLCY